MERVWQNYRKALILYGCIIAAWLLFAAFGRQTNHAVFLSPEFSADDRTIQRNTSITYRYPDEFENTLKQYSQFKDMYQEDKSMAMPGLTYTNLGFSYSTEMVPQGICIVGDYILVTAHDSEKSQNSVIYVLSMVERRFLTTIVLPDTNHVGGITFDGKNIWIAKSTSGYLSVISTEQLNAAIKSKEESYLLKKYDKNVYCGMTASFVTWFGNQLWVGTYYSKESGNGELACFEPTETKTGINLQLEYVVDIPRYAQSVSFLEKNGSIKMMVSTSFGKHSDSIIYLYEVDVYNPGLIVSLLGKYRFPPMAQGMIGNEEYTYIIFESAATCYSSYAYTKCVYPVDRICVLSNEKLIENIKK